MQRDAVQWGARSKSHFPIMCVGGFYLVSAQLEMVRSNWPAPEGGGKTPVARIAVVRLVQRRMSQMNLVRAAGRGTPGSQR